MHPHTEQARSALRVLQAMKATVAESLFQSLQRSIMDLDEENHELGTIVARSISMSDAALPLVLPPAYRPQRFSPSERKLTEALYAAHPSGVSLAGLLMHITGDEADERGAVEPYKILSVWVCRARRVLREARVDLIEAGHPSYIANMFSEGYRLSHEPPTRTCSAETARQSEAITTQEVRVLEFLKANKGKAFDCNQLYEVGGFKSLKDKRQVISNAMSRLRKLKGAPVMRQLGGGYAWVV